MAAINTRSNCGMCRNSYNKPKLLDCFHTFCEACLHEQINQLLEDECFTCPSCSRKIKIPEGGARGFSDNIYVDSIDNETKRKPSCDVCTSDVEFNCKDCKQFLCAACKRQHDSFTACFNHEVVNLTEEDLGLNKDCLCSLHNKSHASYCLDCSIIICSRCSGHQHDGHDIASIDNIGDVVDDAKMELKSIKEKLEQKLSSLHGYKTALQVESSKLKSQTVEACKEVDRQVDEACKNMKKQGERIKFDIKNVSGCDNLQLDQIHYDIAQLIQGLEINRTQLATEGTNWDFVEVLTALPKYKDVLENLTTKRFVIPDINLPKFEKSDTESAKVIIGSIKHNKRQAIEHTFSLSEIAEGQQVKSPIFMVHGIPMKICVRHKAIHKESREPVLDIIIDNEDHLWYMCSISFEIINKQVTQSLRTPFQKSLTWSDAITISKLSDHSRGFIDKLKKFRVKVSFR